MSKRDTHHRRRPGVVAINTMQIAASGARKLSDTDVQQQVTLMRRALDEFIVGQHCEQHWRSLADTANMAETLAGMGLGSGDDAERVIDQAQRALHDAHKRHAQRGSWTLWADEIDALRWLLSLHAVQLEACSYREFERAYRSTAQRMAQALAGNAAPGVMVIDGGIGGNARAAA